MTDTSTRAAQFLNAMAHQKEPIQVKAHSASRGKARIGGQLLNALKMGLPALALSVSVHAQTPTPAIDFSIDQGPSDILSLSDLIHDIDKTMGFKKLSVNSYETPEEKAERATANILECFNESIANTEMGSAERLFTTMSVVGQAPDVINDIQDWSDETHIPFEIGVAAFCQSPFNWKAQLSHWEKAAKDVAEKTNDQSAVTTLMQAYTSNALELHTMQRASQYQAITQAAYYQQEKFGDNPDLRHQVNGYDWVNAVVSIGRGAAALSGSQDNSNIVNDTARTVQKGAYMTKRIDNVANSNRKGANRWSEIGRAAQDIGRTIHSPSRNRSPGMRN